MSPESVNEVSPLHSHEPVAPPVYDDEGRCLICGVEVALQDVGRIVADLARRLDVARLFVVSFSCEWCLGDGQGDHATDCAKRGRPR